ncbi:MAG: hypothetical protein KBA31_20530 [Alphaproteobacteria bacterium]|nr:hypothetical protein [Alphaproteobacteria bacterium]
MSARMPDAFDSNPHAAAYPSARKPHDGERTPKTDRLAILAEILAAQAK